MNANLPCMAVITSILPLTGDTNLLTLAVSGEKHRGGSSPARFQPGQFVQLSLPGIGEMPISYCGLPRDDGIFELCVRSVGRVSSALNMAAPGTAVGVRAPLGKGFPVEEYGGQDILMIAGGVGMAPIRSLLLALLQQGERIGSLTLLHGARERKALLFGDELRRYAGEGRVRMLSTVDHREPEAGEIADGCRTGLLPALIDECRFVDPATTSVALCAPPVAYDSLVAKLRVRGIPDERMHLSLERQMKCGIGRCGHCAVGSLLCCVDGPVFRLDQIRC